MKSKYMFKDYFHKWKKFRMTEEEMLSAHCIIHPNPYPNLFDCHIGDDWFEYAYFEGSTSYFK